MIAALVGWVVLVGLTGLAGVAALAVAVRSAPASRAELGIVASAVFFAMLATPVLVLGYANVLGAMQLGLFAACTFVMVLAVATHGAPVAARWQTIRRAAASLGRLPADAFREALATRSFVALGLGYCGVVLVAATLLTIFAPNATWDGFLYHEPMMGFAIQNHGFSVVDLPMNQANQATNGYPRLCESLSIWFVIFTDKTLIELPSVLAAPALMLAAYALARRFGDRVTAMGWACVLLLMPQVWAELCQTLIDVLVGFFGVFAVYFATRPNLRVRDAWLSLLGMLLLLGSKSSALTLAPMIGAITAVRLVARHGRSRLRTVLLTLVGGTTLLVGVGGITPLHNWHAFHDPLWPVSLDVAALGIDWKGLITLHELTSSGTTAQAVQIAYGAPVGGPEDVMARGYGYAIAWLLAPLAVAGLVAYAVALARRRLEPHTRATVGVLLVALAGTLWTAPSLNGHNARYDIHIVACAMALATFLLARPGWRRVRTQVMAAALVLAVLPLHWMRGVGWYWVSTAHLEDVLRHPLDSRVALTRPSFDVSGAAREELAAGDCVVFDEHIGFIGALWNFHFSNRLRYVPYGSNPAFFSEVEQCQATWVVVGEKDPARQALEAAHAPSWEYVGELTKELGAIYRRKSAPGS